ncbi:hypothetical protein SAY87_010579 [Trapa incisa]|uniref:non-specific serine/threonine protein kinase n=1 Tax=Trapa incisa TaxID=236973 RepID=A0AAN7GWL4_9MYRT|nr:hypothetical protein SAY87_010579 [Trapa incisa]
MARALSAAAVLPCSLLFLLIPLRASSQNNSTEFIFNGFNTSNLYLSGASVIKPSGVLKLTNISTFDMGHAFYGVPIRMLNPNASSFSSYFVFAINPRVSGQGGFGLAFVVAPKTRFPGAEAEHYLGLFNSTTDKDPSNHMLVIEFDTVNGYEGYLDREGNHVGININGMQSKANEPAAYYVNNTDQKEDMKLESGEAIQAWVEYNATSKLISVTISPISILKPLKPLVTTVEDLDKIFLEDMYVGFSAATGETRSFHYVLGWSFGLNGSAPALNLSQLPLPPTDSESSNSYRPTVVAIIAVLCALTVCLLGALVFYTFIRKRFVQEGLEDWELDCPHRFRYKELHTATKGFKESEKIGVGGFGSVYRGVLPTNNSEVAVKKITRKNSEEGMREFVAEIESLGRLRHKNLVNLQGWCKHKNELLLIYDYIPNGSLYSLIFDRQFDGFVLSWDQRFHVLKGIAAGLLYLHEEWEQVVIHRDVKSSNVLIDAEMNARLGDFGLARLYDHGQMSHTTRVVGTIGYIAPELARTGKASASSDVFAFGILLLEVTTGRHPIGPGPFMLVDWVIECHEQGQLFDVVDQRLNSVYTAEEMRLVLLLGLLCSHPQPDSRPTMRQVVRYLNRDDPFPLSSLGSVGSRRDNNINSRFLELLLSDAAITSSNALSSIGAISTSSLGSGR